jgi:hypothetical protein
MILALRGERNSRPRRPAERRSGAGESAGVGALKGSVWIFPVARGIGRGRAGRRLWSAGAPPSSPVCWMTPY